MGPLSRVYSCSGISKKKKTVLPLRSSGKCHAILSRVGGIAAMVVVKEPQALKPTGGRPFGGSLKKKRERERRRKRIDGHTMHLAQGGRQTEGGETTIKCNRCNRICHIYAQMRHSNDCYALS